MRLYSWAEPCRLSNADFFCKKPENAWAQKRLIQLIRKIEKSSKRRCYILFSFFIEHIQGLLRLVWSRLKKSQKEYYGSRQHKYQQKQLLKHTYEKINNSLPGKLAYFLPYGEGSRHGIVGVNTNIPGLFLLIHPPNL